MFRSNSVNAKVSNSQLIKLKSVINFITEVSLTLSSNMISNSNDETDFCHKLLVTDRQVSKLLQIIHQII